MRELALTGLERAPELAEWIEPSLLARQHWPAWRAALAPKSIQTRPTASARKRLSYDEIFANQLALLLLRQVARRKRGVPLKGDGRITAKLKLPYQLTGAQARVIGEIRGDMAQDRPMLRLLQGDVGSGKTLVALAGDARSGRGGGAGGDARPDRNPRAPALCDALGAMRGDRRARRDPDRARKGPGARGGADGSRRRQRSTSSSARTPSSRRMSAIYKLGLVDDRRAASLRRVAAAACCRKRPSARRTCWR